MTTTDYMIFDPAGRPSIPTNSRWRVEHMIRQGWSAVRFLPFGGGAEEVTI